MTQQDTLYDIYGHWHVPFWQTKMFKISLIAFFVLLFAELLFFLFKKYRKEKLLTPGQQALKRLNALAQKKIELREDAHAVYFELTQIMKKFFGSYFAIPFEQLTDQEMVAQLEKLPQAQWYGQSLQEIVDSSLHVKYAQENALEEQVKENIKKASDIITRLIQDLHSKKK